MILDFIACLWEAGSQSDQEVDCIASGSAGKAFEYLLDRAYIHAWPVVGMERAKPLKLLAHFHKRKVLANNINYVIGLLNSHNEAAVKFSGHYIPVKIIK